MPTRWGVAWQLSSSPLGRIHVNESNNKRWLRAVILFGIVYAVVGITFGEFGWRVAAWLVSGAAFAAHIGYEHFRIRNSSRRTALHASGAAALGAFGLAVAANAHELWANPANHRLLLLLSLVLWPILTAVPAFVVALTVAAVLARMRPRI